MLSELGRIVLENVKDRDIFHWEAGSIRSRNDRLIGEEPLSIRLEGKPYAVVMRTPGEELAHAAGFCLGEGIVDTPKDMRSLGFCDGTDTNVVAVTLSDERRKAVPEMMDRRQYISQTSCGLCGKEVVADLFQKIQPLDDDVVLGAASVYEEIDKLPSIQPLRRLTKTSHAAAIFTRSFDLLSSAEDVGRHNALDKAVGKLFLEGGVDRAEVLLLSSRISYELVQKAARAKIPVILAVSRPTSLAVELAEGLNMTLVCLAKEAGLDIFCGGHRIA